jgi:ribonuclease HI
LKHVIYVDAGFSNGRGRLACYDEMTGKAHYKASECKDSFRCEYEAILYALDRVKDAAEGDELEVRIDNEVVVKQLNHESGINEEDVRRRAFKVWDWCRKKEGKVTFVRVPRKENKAGKILGS